MLSVLEHSFCRLINAIAYCLVLKATDGHNVKNGINPNSAIPDYGSHIYMP